MNQTTDVIAIPRFALVVLMGPTCSGKSTFAKRFFPEGCVVSESKCLAMVADDECATQASAEAYAVLETWVRARLKLGRLTVVDSLALEPRFRLRMLDLARDFHAPALLLALEAPQRVCQERDSQRAQPQGPEEIQRQLHRFFKSTARAREEGWNRVIRLRGTDVERERVEVRPLRVDSPVPPPYDLIGDIHGCFPELCALLERLGYQPDEEAGYVHPQGRRVVFVGDLVDRGPASLKVLGLAMRMHRAGTALVTPGNHDNKLLRHLSGGRVRLDHGLERTVAELEALSEAERTRFVAEAAAFLRNLPPYLLLDQGRLVVAHAGLPEHLQGRLSRSVSAWALYGEIRPRGAGVPQPRAAEWPNTYQGRALVVYGHTPSAEVRARGNTICIDQGCVFGGKLTAYRYPEAELMQVQAFETWYPDDAPDLDMLGAPAGGEGDAPAVVEVRPSEDGLGDAPAADVGGESREDSENAATGLPGGSAPEDSSLEGFSLMPDRMLLGQVGLEGSGSEAGQPDVDKRESVDAADGTEGEGTIPLQAGAARPDVARSDVARSDVARSDVARSDAARPDATQLPCFPSEQVAGAEGPTMEAPPGGFPDVVPLLSGSGLPTRRLGAVPVRSQLVSAALEELVRFGVDPRWIVYLPPTIAPPPSSPRADCLEHPREVFQHYHGAGQTVVAEEMHLSTRGVVIVGQSREVCRERFGLDAPGVIYSSTGRALFHADLQNALLERIRTELEANGAFERLKARLLIFESGFMPWTLKYQDYLARQCLPAASSLLASRSRAVEALDLAAARGVPVRSLLNTAVRDRDGASRLHRVLERSVWPVKGLETLKLAPFQLLANEHGTYFDLNRLQQLEELDRWCVGSSLFQPTRRVPIRSAEAERAATALWEELSAVGAGMVVRTLEWFPRQGDRLELPAMKIRGREFLRVTYGPQYLSPELLGRLKERPLRTLRSMALREWVLASEGLERFADGAPYADYHLYALAVLASRAEPLDPRL